jgi:hypothetical protein
MGNIITLPKNSDGGYYAPSTPIGQPGDTIILDGDYAYIYMMVHGQPGNPITITNKGLSRCGVNGNYGLIIIGEYFILDGTGDPNFKYGIKVTNDKDYIAQGVGLADSMEYEIKNVEIEKAQVGFFSNFKVGRTKTNIKIHDCYVHNLNNPSEAGRSECIYFGNTSLIDYNEPSHYENLEIYNMICDDLWGDGIQVCMTRGLKIHNCQVTNYGKANLEYQQTGILLGGCTSGDIYDNIVTDGTGTGIQAFGVGQINIRRNKILRTSSGNAVQDAIYINSKGTNAPLIQIAVEDNEIDGANRDGIRHASETALRGLIKNNKISNIKGMPVNSSWDDIIDILVTPTPTTTTTPSPTATVTKTPTKSATPTKTVTPSPSVTKTPTNSPSNTPSPSPVAKRTLLMVQRYYKNGDGTITIETTTE